MDANNFFANRRGTPLGSFKRNQLGVTLGGPIRHDKAFFFVNYEALRQRTANDRSFTIRQKSKVEFRAEFFNLFNSPLFGLPEQVSGNAAFGVVSTQANTPRQVQLGLKAIF
jgi:hypothetical protein